MWINDVWKLIGAAIVILTLIAAIAFMRLKRTAARGERRDKRIADRKSEGTEGSTRPRKLPGIFRRRRNK